jgi:hypothetical protein
MVSRDETMESMESGTGPESLCSRAHQLAERVAELETIADGLIGEDPDKGGIMENRSGTIGETESTLQEVQQRLAALVKRFSMVARRIQ